MRRLAPLVALVSLAACGSAAGGAAGDVANTSSTAASAPATTASTATTGTTLAPTTTTAPPPVRSVVEQAYTPYGMVGGVTLHHPAAVVERVGFHESNHDGARPVDPLPTAANAVELESRERDTLPRTASDIVVDPAAEIRAPVTGTVIRAGGYTLYCVNSDEYVVIEPDAHPGWEVKVLHIVGVQVRRGDRVVAGETMVAQHARVLPFESQVDELRTVDPAWPHVHVEVVDPSIPDRPSPGGGC